MPSGYHPPPHMTAPCEEGMSRCIECGECRSDPSDFYDGLRCKVCCEEPEPEDEEEEES